MVENILSALMCSFSFFFLIFSWIIKISNWLTIGAYKETMLCRSFLRLTAVSAGAENHKLQTLHKLLIGEVQFKNNVPLKYCNVVHKFGENWKEEIESYANSLPEDNRAVLQRQIARLMLTRYTTRELAMYGGDGPEKLDENARKANVDQGKVYLAEHGEEAFENYVKTEAKYANWTDEQALEFINAVKQAA